MLVNGESHIKQIFPLFPQQILLEDVRLRQLYCLFNRWVKPKSAALLIFTKINPTGTSAIPSYRACNAESVTMTLRYDVMIKSIKQIHRQQFLRQMYSVRKWHNHTTKVDDCIVAERPPSLDIRQVLMKSTQHLAQAMAYTSGQSAQFPMMTSSNANISRITGPLCGNFTGHRWIPLTSASDT